MTPERCQATAASGRPCSAKPRPGRPYCLWHDPDAAALRLEIARKGGHASSNAQRVKKHLPPAFTTEELIAVLSGAIRKVEAGELEPGVVNAMSGAAKAIASLHEMTTLERRLAELEQAAGLANDRRFG